MWTLAAIVAAAAAVAALYERWSHGPAGGQIQLPASDLTSGPGAGRASPDAGKASPDMIRELARRAMPAVDLPAVFKTAGLDMSTALSPCGDTPNDWMNTATWSEKWLGDALPLAQRLDMMKQIQNPRTWPAYARRVWCALRNA